MLRVPLLADGTERTRRIPGSQTGLELGDLREGVTYLVRVSALAGGREGSAATVTIRLSKFLSGFGIRSLSVVLSSPLECPLCPHKPSGHQGSRGPPQGTLR